MVSGASCIFFLAGLLERVFGVREEVGKLTGKRTGCSIVFLSFVARVSYGSRQMTHSLFAGSSLRGTDGNWFRKSAILMLIHVFNGTFVQKKGGVKEGSKETIPSQ